MLKGFFIALLSLAKFATALETPSLILNCTNTKVLHTAQKILNEQQCTYCKASHFAICYQTYLTLKVHDDNCNKNSKLVDNDTEIYMNECMQKLLGNGTQSNSNSYENTILRAASIPSILVCGLLGAVFPKVLLMHGLRGPVGLLNVFAAGVFIAAGLVHLLGDAADAFGDTEYPWPYAICGLSLAVLWCLEYVAVGYTHNAPKERGSRVALLGSINEDEEVTPLHVAIVTWGALLAHSFLTGLALGTNTRTSTGISLLVAVLVHKWLAMASMAHIMFGTTKEEESKRLQWVLMIILVASTPVGVAVGWSISTHPSNLLQGILKAVSSGTFLYVGLLEVLSDDKYDEFIPVARFMKPVFVLAGYSLMSLLAEWS
eukprot:m.20181 g.20181  ORF g.20181 m.20181 type:complete len:374 (-) comp6770_c0_seq1:97-1218(-)